MNITQCYENLANAIVLKAVEEYRVLLECLQYEPNNSEAANQKMEIERFFRSDLFSSLTRIDCEMLIRRMNAEVSR